MTSDQVPSSYSAWISVSLADQVIPICMVQICVRGSYVPPKSEHSSTLDSASFCLIWLSELKEIDIFLYSSSSNSACIQ